MFRTFRIVLVGLLVLALIAAGLVTLVLRDNPARAPVGTTHLTRHDGVQVQYLVSGPADAPLVPLLASYARSASDFNELVAALNAAGYRTLTLQPRGVEQSALPSLQPSLFDYADDLAAALDAEQQKGKALCLVGHAFGNRIARAFATRYPDRADSLVLLAAGDGAPPPETSAAISTLLVKLWPEARRREALQQAFFARANQAPDYWLSGWYPRAALAQAYATANTPRAEWVDGGTAPMLIVQPAEDAAAAEGAAVLRQRFPERVRVVVFEDTGHAILPEQPERVRDLIIDHLARRGC